MTYKFHTLTANCGNSTLGEEACKKINSLLTEDSDFIVINCQEVNFEKALEQIKEKLPQGYSVQDVGRMVTYTKKKEILGNTGIATFVVRKDEIEVQTKFIPIRRKDKWTLRDVSAYNKGALLCKLEISRAGVDPIRVQTISGHLESKNISKRTTDWLNIHREIAKSRNDVSSWDKLANMMPNLRLSGYDANTRRKKDGSNYKNLWQSNPNTPEIQALNQACLASKLYSRDSTFKSDELGILTTADVGRVGYARGGMLDFAGIMGGNNIADEIDTKNGHVINIETNHKRDHLIIISAVHSYENEKINEFENTRDQISVMLSKFAPELSKNVENMDLNEESKDKLLQIYQNCLSKEGLLIQYLELHERKLLLQEVAKKPFLKDCSLNNHFFSENPWCGNLQLGADDFNEAVVKKEHELYLSRLFIESLSRCESKEGADNIIAWFILFKEKISCDAFDKEEAKRLFDMIIAIDDYRDHLRQEFGSRKTIDQVNKLADDSDHSGDKLVNKWRVVSELNGLFKRETPRDIFDGVKKTLVKYGSTIAQHRHDGYFMSFFRWIKRLCKYNTASKGERLSDDLNPKNSQQNH